MKIAFISQNTWARWGGSEELWSRAAHVLLREGHEVMACVAAWEPLAPQLLALRSAGARVHPVALRPRTPLQKAVHLLRGRPPTPPVEELTTSTIIAPFHPDVVVISQGYNLDGLLWAESSLTCGLPHLLVAQAAYPYGWPVDPQFERLRRIYREARGVFFVSRHNRDLTEQQLALDLPHGFLISNPFVISYDEPPVWPDGDQWRLAHVARLEPGAKGQDILFALLAQPKWRERPLHVTICGGGNSSESVRALAAKLDLPSVTFAGQVGDIAAIWRTHHGLILPSRSEGMSLALIEAMLCHRFAIVTDVGGNAELVEHGRCGFIAESPTVAALGRAMDEAWGARDRWRELGLAAGRRVREVVPRDPAQDFAARILALARATA